MGPADPEAVRCPVCGRGRLRDLVYDEGGTGPPLQQRSDSHEVQMFTCGHEVLGAALDTADGGRLDVEQRSSEETVDPQRGG
jgi:hypothetical protein